jgi:aconitate hydratase
MMRGTFANINLKNRLVPWKEGGWTRHFPEGEEMAIYDAAMLYKQKRTPLIIIAGKEYGSGSSRDWAAKGTYLLGVEAVLAESFERIHRSNLLGMGVLPLQFKNGENADTLGLRGDEVFDIQDVGIIKPGGELHVVAKADAKETTFNVISRLDAPIEVEFYLNGGILHTFLRNILKK